MGNDTSADTIIYHSPDELKIFLQEIYRQYPEITYIEPAGTSLEGREIYALTISDNPLCAESEPRIRITGSIHGDENVTTEVIIRFIRHLFQGYLMGDERIISIINNRYMVFIPMMNPDGVVHGTRYNANDVDLNRNFSREWAAGSDHGDSPFSEPESRGVRDYSLFMGFHLSITYHTGAVIVNMPFDYVSLHFDGTAPDEYNLVSYIGEVYTTRGQFLQTPGLLDSQYVYNGTINGGDWYVVHGSMQDWSYLETGCIDYTIEISKNKKPASAEEIDELFMLNLNSILAFIETAGIGVYGRVTDPNSKPLPARITIAGGDIITNSDTEGYYHRILLPGAYTITFTADGYQDYSDTVTIQNAEDAVRLDITMTP